MLVDLKANAKNPFTDMLHWINQEEIDVEAMIEGIKSIVSLIDKKKKLNDEKEDFERDIIKLQEGKSTFKSFLSLKSKKDDLITVENKKSRVSYLIKCFIKQNTLNSKFLLIISKLSSLD